ncbi:hypothetical protein NDU88_003182 [Pleurodeles waltl]|uniref:Uncharacterized protein n=1 Tax=Pleurodeles waltl TaxID=8319 RepID=A0AAV7W4L1_PLEWA|nr:hypothetical protein NDU88_003182 [Pleurodeles waltl]
MAHGTQANPLPKKRVFRDDTDVKLTRPVDKSIHDQLGNKYIPSERAVMTNCIAPIGCLFSPPNLQGSGRCKETDNHRRAGGRPLSNSRGPLVSAFAPTCSFSPQRAPNGLNMLAKNQSYKHGSNTLFLNNVPRLPQGVKEDCESRVKKAIHWLRNQRGCLSLIRTDISNAKRLSPPEFNHDIISIEFYDKTLIEHLIAFDIRARLLWVQKKGGINLEFGTDDVAQAIANVQKAHNPTSNP